MNRALPIAALCAILSTGCTLTTPGHDSRPVRPSASHQEPSQAPSSAPAPRHHHALREVHDPGHVTGTLQGPCHSFGGGQLPDPHCTPGSVDPAMTAAVLCAPAYTTDSYRPPSGETSRFKHEVAFPAYGIPGDAAPSELDHLVPLALGGANDSSNLWPQMGPIPNPKDSVERDLAGWVCDGGPGVAQGRLEAAQAAIAGDWTHAEKTLGIGG